MDKLEKAFLLQDTFGRQIDDLKYIAKALIEYVPQSHQELIPDAIDAHIRSSERFPTPSHILEILGLVKKFDKSYYLRLLEKQRNFEAGFSEIAYIKSYEENSRNVLDGHPDLRSSLAAIAGPGEMLEIENKITKELSDGIDYGKMFEVFWMACPKKINEPKTKNKFLGIVYGEDPEIKQTSPDEVIEGMWYYQKVVKDQEDKYIKSPVNWLNESGWLDEHKGFAKPKWGWWRVFSCMEWLIENRQNYHIKLMLEKQSEVNDIKWNWYIFGPPPGHPEFFLFEVDQNLHKLLDGERFDEQVQKLIDRFGLLEEKDKKAIPKFTKHYSRESKNELLPWQRYEDEPDAGIVENNFQEKELEHGGA